MLKYRIFNTILNSFIRIKTGNTWRSTYPSKEFFFHFKAVRWLKHMPTHLRMSTKDDKLIDINKEDLKIVAVDISLYIGME